MDSYRHREESGDTGLRLAVYSIVRRPTQRLRRITIKTHVQAGITVQQRMQVIDNVRSGCAIGRNVDQARSCRYHSRPEAQDMSFIPENSRKPDECNDDHIRNTRLNVASTQRRMLFNLHWDAAPSHGRFARGDCLARRIVRRLSDIRKQAEAVTRSTSSSSRRSTGNIASSWLEQCMTGNFRMNRGRMRHVFLPPSFPRP